MFTAEICQPAQRGVVLDGRVFDLARKQGVCADGRLAKSTRIYKYSWPSSSEESELTALTLGGVGN